MTDPVKVTRSALQNAASIAGLFLTTEAVVANKPGAEVCCPGRRCRHGLLIRKRSQLIELKGDSRESPFVFLAPS